MSNSRSPFCVEKLFENERWMMMWWGGTSHRHQRTRYMWEWGLSISADTYSLVYWSTWMSKTNNHNNFFSPFFCFLGQLPFLFLHNTNLLVTISKFNKLNGKTKPSKYVCATTFLTWKAKCKNYSKMVFPRNNNLMRGYHKQTTGLI